MYINLEKLPANSVTLQVGQLSSEADCLALSFMVAITIFIFGALTSILGWVTGHSASALTQDRGSRAALLIVTIAIAPFVLKLLLPELPLSPTLWLSALAAGVGVFLILEALSPPSIGGL